MQNLGASSFYDSLNKLLIGFLILLPLLGNCQYFACNELAFLAIACWLVGIFFWAIRAYILSPVLNKIPCLSRNNIRQIKYTYIKVSKDKKRKYTFNDIEKDTIEYNDYLAMYYSVQRQGLLGNIPVLESLSSFFLNFILVLIYWIILILWNSGCCQSLEFIYFTVSQCACHVGTCPYFILLPVYAIVSCIVLICLSCLFRYRTENHIYSLIIEAYLLSK